MESAIAWAGRQERQAQHGQRGFTLVELTFVVTVIIVLMALVMVSVGRSIRTARVAGERYYLSSLRTGVEQFKVTFGFYPPLIDGIQDAPPMAGGRAFVQGATGSDPQGLKHLQDQSEARYSEFSLPVYLLGTPDLADGQLGAGQARPQRDGTWDLSAPKVEPFFDPTRDAMRFAGGKFCDRWGNAIRYYRWEPTREEKYLDGGALNPAVGEIARHNVPHALMDTSEVTWGQNKNQGAGIRGASFAIVSKGEDGVIVDAPWTAITDRHPNKDNIVEVGR